MIKSLHESIDAHEPAGSIGGEVVQSTCLGFHRGGDEKLQQGTGCQNCFINKCCVHLQSSQCLVFNVVAFVVLLMECGVSSSCCNGLKIA